MLGGGPRPAISARSGFSGLWNTGTALSHGMLGEIGELGGKVAKGAVSAYHDAGHALSHYGTTALHNGASSLLRATGQRISGAWHEMGRD